MLKLNIYSRMQGGIVHHQDFIIDAKNTAHKLAFYLQIQKKFNKKLVTDETLSNILSKIKAGLDNEDIEELNYYRKKYLNVQKRKYLYY